MQYFAELVIGELLNGLFSRMGEIIIRNLNKMRTIALISCNYHYSLNVVHFNMIRGFLESLIILLPYL